MTQIEIQKFPKIKRLPPVIKEITQRVFYKGHDSQGKPTYDFTAPVPAIKYQGTQKIKGVNCGVTYYSGVYCAQTKTRILAAEEDFFGFNTFVLKNKKLLQELFYCFSSLGKSYHHYDQITLYGQWVGAGVNVNNCHLALSKTPTGWYIFAYRVADKIYFTAPEGMEKFSAYNIYHINNFQTKTISFCFDDLCTSLQRIKDFTVEHVKNCAVYNKLTGKVGRGEGLVWKPLTPAWDNPSFWFKTTEHDVSSLTRQIKEAQKEDFFPINKHYPQINYTHTDYGRRVMPPFVQ